MIFDDIIELGFIPIADDSGGNQICLGLNKEFYGNIYFWIHDEDPGDMKNMYFLADNFKEFIDKLYDEMVD